MLSWESAQCVCESPHPCLLHPFADGFYLHISLQSILFPNECLFNIGAHTAAAMGGRAEFLRVRRRGALCPGQGIVLRSLSRVPWAISPTYSLARAHEF